MSKRYPDIAPWEVEPFYSEHVAAMTAERLHGKAEIAAQLAWRDQRIAELEARLPPIVAIPRVEPVYPNWCECEEFGQSVAIPCFANCPTVKARVDRERGQR